MEGEITKIVIHHA